MLAAALSGWLPSGTGLATAEEWRVLLAERAGRSVVSVVPDVPQSAMNMDEPEGTGFAIDDGMKVLTADHVIGSANTVRLRRTDGSLIDAEILVRDSDTDLALLSVTDRLQALPLKPGLPVGSDVCVAGNAFGLGISLTCGILSASDLRGIGFNRIEDFLQTDASVNPGMSGAPLFDRDGQVAGIVTAIFTKGQDGNLGVNFASSVRLIEAFLADARDGMLDRRPQGLLLRAPSGTGDADSRYPEVVRVIDGSPEAEGGLVTGDRLVAINDLAVRGQPDYLLAVMLFGAPDTHVYSIVRDGEAMTLPIRVGNTVEEEDE